MRLILIGRAAHIALHHGLDCHEVLIEHESFMRPLDLYHSVSSLLCTNGLWFGSAALFALSKNTDVIPH